MNNPDVLHLLQRYQQGECTPEERQLVEHWYSLLGHEQPPLTLTAAERQQLRTTLWQRIEAQTFEGEDASAPAVNRGHAVRWRWAAAAVVALGLGVGAQRLLPTPGAAPVVATASPRQASGWHTYHNTTRQAHSLRLADGSTVRVAAGGQLKYPRRFAAGHRTVYLRGEAFFQITPDKAHPFRVYTHEVVTTVLGTSFLVRAPENREPVVVKVRTGRVQVTPRATSAGAAPAPAGVLVLPNQQAVYSPGRQQLQRELVAEPVQLAAQSFAFDDRPVAEVLTALQKAYGVDIQYNAAALAGCTVTLNLPDESLYNKLDVLCKALGATYTISNTRIVFTSPSCAAR